MYTASQSVSTGIHNIEPPLESNNLIYMLTAVSAAVNFRNLIRLVEQFLLDGAVV